LLYLGPCLGPCSTLGTASLGGMYIYIAAAVAAEVPAEVIAEVNTEIAAAAVVAAEAVIEVVAELKARVKIRQLEEPEVFNSLRLSIVLLTAIRY
jgi:hypothetical protein